MFLNYYSKIRASTEGNIEQMIAKENNRIITKEIDATNWDVFQQTELRSKLFNLYNLLAEWRGTDIKNLAEHYKEFRIPKRSGGYRTLHAPDDELKEHQLLILNFLTDDCKILCHNAVHSFVKHRSSKTALDVHRHHHARWFLKLDIKDFFDNCNSQFLLHILQEIHPLNLLPYTELRYILRICMYDNGLPQGAPTSPLLSNLYLMAFDYWLTNTLKGYTYTRYADDILISSPTDFVYTNVVRDVIALLPPGLLIKQEKLRYGSCNGSNWNLGLMYNKDREITVGYQKKHLIKNRIHNTFTNVPEKDTPEYRVWLVGVCELKGLLSYYKYIEPIYFTNLINKYRELGYDL